MCHFSKHTNLSTGMLLIQSLVLALSPIALAVPNSTTELHSLSKIGEGDYPHYYAAASAGISNNGRFVVYYSWFTNELDATDNNEAVDTFLYDRHTAQSSLISQSSKGVRGNDGSTEGSVSDDGRYVVFYSHSTNLVKDDNNGNSDVFLRDTVLGKTTAISISRNHGSVTAAGSSSAPKITADGKYIAFQSSAVDMDPADQDSQIDIYVFTQGEDYPRRVSLSYDNQAPDGNCYLGGISADGSKVVFSSDATNLVANDTNNHRDVFLRDLKNETTVLVSRTPSTLANADCDQATISPDGSYVAFSTTASNLDSQDGNSVSDIYVAAVPDGQPIRVSMAPQAVAANGGSFSPAISNDGRFIAFYSDATNLVAADANGFSDVFLRDRITGETNIISKEVSGVQGDERSSHPFMSSDGLTIAFSSSAQNLTWKACCTLGMPFVASTDPDSLEDFVYAPWNGFLGMTNVLELVNRSDKPVRVLVGLDQFAIDTPVNLPARGQFDVILNDLPGFAANNYGIVYLGYQEAKAVDGRVLYYKPSTEVAGEYDFSFAFNLRNASFGKSYVAFNTYQPSLNPLESTFAVKNWLTIANTAITNDPTPADFTVKTYSMSGELRATTSLQVEPGRRQDIDGGHGLGANNVGYLEITPANDASPYQAQLTRYGESSANSYDFAFPLVSQSGFSTSWLGISSGANAQNWVELQNILSEEIEVELDFFANDGTTAIDQRVFKLPPRSGYHVDASAIVNGGRSGAVLITSNRAKSLIAQSMFYFRNPQGSINAMYGKQAGSTVGGVRYGSWNLFLGMYNWLRIFNTSAEVRVVKLKIYNGDLVTPGEFLLSGNNGFDLGLHETATYKTSLNSYGLIEVQGNDLLTEVIRIKPSGSGEPDFVATTNVKR